MIFLWQRKFIWFQVAFSLNYICLTEMSNETSYFMEKKKEQRTVSWSALWRLLFVNANVNHFASAFCLFSKSLMRFKLLCIVVARWPTLLTLLLILVVFSVKEMTSDVYTTGRDAHLVQNNPLFIFAVLLTDLLWLFFASTNPTIGISWYLSLCTSLANIY